MLDLRSSPLSVKNNAENGREATFTNGKAKIHQKNKIVEIGSRKGSLYVLDTASSAYSQNHMAYIANIDTWHKRLGHASPQGTIQMESKILAISLHIQKGHSIMPCNVFLLEKLRRTNIPKTADPKTRALRELIYSDFSDPTEKPSKGETRYFVTFIDDASKWVAA